MKKLYLLILVSFFIGSSAHAQYSKYIIQLKNKGGTTHSLSNPSTYLSAKAIERRTRQKLTLDSTDLPVSATYLTAIRQVPNVTVLNVSKWLNQVLIATTDAAALTQINNLPFVIGTSPIAVQARPNDNNPVSSKFKEVITSLPPSEIRNGAYGTSGSQGTPVLNYGNSFAQIHLHEGEYLHDLGFTGQGITIAILDAGFYGYKTNSAIDSVRLQNRVLGEWDYVMNETSVTEDHPHGLYCLSIIGANKPGQIIGSAPHAKFFLLRTEDAATEYPVEEQNWVVAAEFADSAGVDMIT